MITCKNILLVGKFCFFKCFFIIQQNRTISKIKSGFPSNFIRFPFKKNVYLQGDLAILGCNNWVSSLLKFFFFIFFELILLVLFYFYLFIFNLTVAGLSCGTWDI